MYKELIFIKNNDKWDYVFDVSLTENNPTFTEDGVINFLLKEYDFLKKDDIEIFENEIYILTENQLPCKNCGLEVK